MAKVKIVNVPKGEFFGGAGVAVFNLYRNKQSPSQTDQLTPEMRLARAAEAALLRLVSQPQNLVEGEEA